MKNRFGKKMIRIMCIIFVMVMLFPMNIFAASAEKATLTIKHPISDIYCRIYKVADYSEAGGYKLVKPFDHFADEVELLDIIEIAPDKITTNGWRQLGLTLKNYLKEPTEYEMSEGVVKEGKVVFSDVDTGLYLITADSAIRNGKVYVSPSMLITVENPEDAGKRDYEVKLDYSSKLGTVHINESYSESYSVQKIWKSHTDATPVKQEVTVDLYAEGVEEPYDTVKLNEENNWSYTWKGLPSGKVWSVKEREVLENYKVLYSQNGAYFVIENVYYPPEPSEDSLEEDSPEEDSPEALLPQTGQLWWPVPILMAAGVFFVIMGYSRRN